MKQLSEIVYLDIEENKEYEDLINKVLETCFETEKILNKKLYISLTLTTPEQIQKINKEYRNIDNPTDVLSFPMFEKDELKEVLENTENDLEEVLGDIIISVEKIYEQAEEYGHSFERELAYMVVHGFYHLMGEDHMEEQEKQQMRIKEENVLNKLNINR